MPRKPNYGFERRERDRLKAEKKAEREKAKAERREAHKAVDSPAATGGEIDEDGPADTTPAQEPPVTKQ